jgi:uncharacterized membrane protein
MRRRNPVFCEAAAHFLCALAESKVDLFSSAATQWILSCFVFLVSARKRLEVLMRKARFSRKRKGKGRVEMRHKEVNGLIGFGDASKLAY